MSIKQYGRGILGSFAYDDAYFMMFADTLKYVSYETNGENIIIPKGIEICSEMFKGSTWLETMPVIPDGVKNCSSMFYMCHKMKEPKDIPDSVENCAAMFRGCDSLTWFPKLPKNLRNCKYMFDKCISLTEAPTFKKTWVSSFMLKDTGCKYYIQNLLGMNKNSIHGVETVENTFERYL